MVALAIPTLWTAYGPIPLKARVDPENQASVRILRRNGFRRHGATTEALDVYLLEHRPS